MKAFLRESLEDFLMELLEELREFQVKFARVFLMNT